MIKKHVVVAFCLGLFGILFFITRTPPQAAAISPELTGRALSLPFSVFSLSDTLEIREGGFGSDLAGHPHNPNQFYALTDRGPITDFSGVMGEGKQFLQEAFTPSIGLFEIFSDGVIRLRNVIPLKRPDGQQVTGLPNPMGMGGTGEVLYTLAGEVMRVDMSQPYHPESNPLVQDEFGLDPEGLVALRDGSFWVSDEYGPHLVHYSADGRELGRINPLAGDTRASLKLPAELANRRANRGMEGLAITPDEQTLVGIMQSAMSHPDASTKNSNLTRIVTVNLATGAIGQYLYAQEVAQHSNSALAAISASEFLVLERDGKLPAHHQAVIKRIYKIDLAQATNLENVVPTNELVQDERLGLTIAGLTLEQYVLTHGWEGLKAQGIVPAPKTLAVDISERLEYPHDKAEGIWIIDAQRLAVINDDDFAITSNANQLEPKFLDNNRSRIDQNTLYIIDQLDLGPRTPE